MAGKARGALNDGFEYREQLGPRAAGLTLIAYLVGRYRHSTEDEWRDRIRQGQVLLQGRTTEAQRRLAPGQSLVWQRPPWREPPVPLGFALLHEDPDLLAVAKPRGLPTLPGGGFLAHTLLAAVRSRYPEASPAHRLGRGTSGLVLLTRSAEVRAAVTAAWHAGGVRRTYRALASGEPARNEFSVESPIGPVPHTLLGTVHGASAHGRPAASVFRVLERRGECALVEAEIATGRPHQIRIHLAAAGHPLVGDPLFGLGGRPLPGTRSLPGDLGYALHAHRLALSHPRTGAPLELECGPPRELRLQG